MGKTLKKKDFNKLNKIPHPKGRKTAQLTRKVIRSSAREKSKLLNHMKQNVVGEKLLWFKNNMDHSSSEPITPETFQKLIESYLGRFDNELSEIELKHGIGMRKKRQHASREDIIKMTKKVEANEYTTCGLEVPDLLSPQQVELLRTWSGELRYLPNFKLIRCTKERLECLRTLGTN